MAPFRWSLLEHDLALAKEVAAKKPSKPDEWEKVALLLSAVFTSDDRKIELKGRGCRERMDRLLEKYSTEDKRALKR